MKPPLFSCLTSRITNNGSLYGRFLLGPLPIDLSLTVATVLRRSLLHNVASFTIVSAEIEGAYHEYASLPGIQESILEILLNLGEVSLTSPQRNFLSSNFRTSIKKASFYFASIKISGPCIVEAKDIHWPKGIFCVKPNAYICTLSSNETFHMRLKIEASTLLQKKGDSSGVKKALSFKSSELQTIYNMNKDHSQTQFFGYKTPQMQSLTASSSNTVPEATGSNNEPSHFNLELLDLKEQTQESQKQPSPLKNYFPISSYCSRKREALKLERLKKKTDIELKEQGLSPYPSLKKDTPLSNLSGYPSFENNQENIKANSPLLFPSLNYNSKPLSRKVTEPYLLTKESPLGPSDPSPFLESKGERNSLAGPEGSGSFGPTIPFFHKTKNKKTENEPLDNSRDFPSLLPLKETMPLAVKSTTYPVEKVNFLIERDDELLGYRHRIILEVWTNGSISPRQAIFDSIGSIIQLIYNFREPIRNVFNSNAQLAP